MNCHYRVIEKGARIGQPESTFGILPALGGVARTIEICGMKNAYELVMTGDMIPADQAYEIGYADIFTGKKQGLPEAIALINYINNDIGGFDPKKYRDYIKKYLQNKEG